MPFTLSRTILRRGLIVLVAAFVYLTAARPQAAPPDETATVDLKVVRYDELEAAVRAQKGKILVVDFWATWCPPCIKMLPHMVEMQRKYAKDGLVVMTVSLDKPEDKEKAQKLLQTKQVAGPNLLLNEKTDFWSAKLKFNGPPLRLSLIARASER